jgi:hypothetical protein
MSREEKIKEAQEMIAEYRKAELAVLRGAQSYNVAGQALTRADLDKIRAGRREWEMILNGLMNNGERQIRQVIPTDDRGMGFGRGFFW